MRPQLAFTLVEMLVVLSILAILGMIVAPVVGQAREGGSRATCLSNLRQLGMATSLYTADYDGLYPYGLDPYTRSITPLDIVFAEPYLTKARIMPDMTLTLAPYVRCRKVYCCPAEHRFDEQQVETSYCQRYGSSYSYDPYPAIVGQNDSYYEKPADTYLMADIDFWHRGQDASDGRLNMLFADYHAKNVTWFSYLNAVKIP